MKPPWIPWNQLGADEKPWVVIALCWVVVVCLAALF